MDGFNKNVNDRWFDLGFADRYFNDIPLVIQTMSPYEARNFIEDLKPRHKDLGVLINRYQ